MPQKINLIVIDVNTLWAGFVRIQKNMKQKYSTMKKLNDTIKKKKFVMYAKKDLVLTMTIKNIKKSGITVIILENIEELPIIFVI